MSSSVGRKEAMATTSHITVVTPNYPSRRAPERGVFVDALVRGWVENGCQVNVVNPIPISALFRWRSADSTTPQTSANVLVQPRYLSVSKKKFFFTNTALLSRAAFVRAALRAHRCLPVPDVFYGKFLLTGGAAATTLAARYGKPCFVDLGESRLLSGMDKASMTQARDILRRVDGIVCVSEWLRDEALELGAALDKVLLIPNEADTSRFKPMAKEKCRQQLGLPPDGLIVIFVGHFIERKGPLRVLEAIRRIGRTDVYGIFLGQGPQQPVGSEVLRAAPVMHDDLPVWLNAADVFVLPTLAEGSCNAIAEALAVGLPVVTSDIEDVRAQVGHLTNVMLVDPMDICALADAIVAQSSRRVRVAKSSRESRSRRIWAWLDARARGALAE